jgi:carbon monoxide dehydrogenase subunit G
MEFSGTFELEDATLEEVWLALSDPDLVWHALPGCQFLARVEDDDPDFDALRDGPR